MIPILFSILIIQIVYVSCSTVRVILVLKEQRYYAAVLGMAEITIYMLGLNLVLQYLNQAISLFVYGLGYGLGILTGAWIEKKIALGYVMMRVITRDPEGTMPTELRKNGFGVTSWIGSGQDGERLMLEVLVKRKSQKQLYRTVLAIDPKAFVVTLEPNRLHGGFLTRIVRK